VREALYLRRWEEQADIFLFENSSLESTFLKPTSATAYLLDEIDKELNPTPRQTIMRFAKSMSKQEAQLDVYPRGSYQDVDKNRALTHWLSVSNLPYNLLDAGGFMNFCFKMNPRFKVPSRPYVQ
jgi:hypothetical protein